MWVLLSTRLRMWLLLVIAVPVARWLVRYAARHTSNPRATTLLRHADTALARRGGGRRRSRTGRAASG